MKVIRGKRALVTGAASGIGRAIALELAREGADLFLVDVDGDKLAEVVFEATTFKGCAVGHACDLTDPEAISEVVANLKHRWGYLDLLINNAGVAYYGPTHKMTREQWDWVLGVNLHAPIRLTSELLPILLERPEAHVLNMCSISGLVAGGRFAAYHVSKFGLIGYSEALRAEYGRRGLGVTALCPGPVRTNLYKNAAGGKPDKPVPTPPWWVCASEEKVARVALKAIRKNKRQVLITPLAHMLFQMKKFTPWLLDGLNHIGRKKKPKPAVAVAQSEQAPPTDTKRAA